MPDSIVLSEHDGEELRQFQERARYIEEVELPEVNQLISNLDNALLAAHQKRQQLFAELRNIQKSASSLEITALRQAHEAKMKSLSSLFVTEETKKSSDYRSHSVDKVGETVGLKNTLGSASHLDPMGDKAQKPQKEENPNGGTRERPSTPDREVGSIHVNSASNPTESEAVEQEASKQKEENEMRDDEHDEEPRTPLDGEINAVAVAASRITPRTPTALLVKRSASLPTPQDAPRPAPAPAVVISLTDASLLPRTKKDGTEFDSDEDCEGESCSRPLWHSPNDPTPPMEDDPIRPLLYEALSKVHQPDLLADEEEYQTAEEVDLVAHLEDKTFGLKNREGTSWPSYPRRQQRIHVGPSASRGRGRLVAAGYSDEAEDEPFHDDQDGDDEDPFPLRRREFQGTGASASGFRSAFVQRRRGVLDAMEMDIGTEEAEEEDFRAPAGSATADVGRGGEGGEGGAVFSLPPPPTHLGKRSEELLLQSTSSPSPPDDSSEPFDDDADEERHRGGMTRHQWHLRNRRKEGNYRLDPATLSHLNGPSVRPGLDPMPYAPATSAMSASGAETIDHTPLPSPPYHIVVPAEESSADSTIGGLAAGLGVGMRPQREALSRGRKNDPASDNHQQQQQQNAREADAAEGVRNDDDDDSLDANRPSGNGKGTTQEEYEVRYQRLYKIFHRFLGKGESGYLLMWQRIGGVNGWQENIRPWELSLILSREKTDIVEFRVGPPSEQRVGIRDNTTEIDQEEVVGFFTHFLSRLPRLEYASLFFSSVCPFDWEALELVEEPFPSLKVLNLRWTRLKGMDLLKAVSIFKRLNVGSLRATNSLVDYGQFNNFGTLAKECKRRLMMY